MAKRKKSAKRGSSRRRRVGAIGGDGLKLAIGATIGAVAAGIVGAKLPATLDPKIKNAGMLVLGIFLAKNSNPIVRGGALGLAAVGGAGLVSGFLPAGTVGALRYDFDRQLSGFNDYPNNPQVRAISGFSVSPNNPQVNVISGIGAGAC